ncbi:hypothetical protein P692DRAFT_20875994 [Suillus brevipes Sb2]|nr:hypothetical protein P692DRAFT_20875994 [Suillus brevipes Sb2]
MKQEHKAVKSSLAHIKTHWPPLRTPSAIVKSDTDDEVTIISPPSKPSLKRHKSMADSNTKEEARPHKRTATAAGPSQLPIPLIRSFTSSSSSLPDTLSKTLADELQPSLTTATWPNGLYVIDIVAGFKRMDSDESLPVHERWKEASDTFRTRLYNAGRTPAGLWDVLRKAIPLRKKTAGTQSRDDEESDVDIDLTL